ncbi:TPA: hypothetical protein ACGJ7L_003758 [Pseudomonas aeruginosa]|uniref:Uncharacterized protein n=4 Tax=Pseudomonas aeruginosa TaxID=287 RepID=A0A9P1R405_PSEAI|nr:MULTISPECIES: hypothetical protein [Pseudomonas]CDI90188.1 hypothetical protein BN889_02130 [Pseudomonas aeruginosa PA38182]AKE70332.1 hypothetical protein YQ19_19585 [Pseudomonas aeruginosa]ARG50652.1 hypothetical protein BFV99_15365 [Pseudomonas aeruginosa]EIU2683155.1 hypothetical protein [Pseudomonas aeruginosa]EIU3428085.1 hypothetical protein [Pseudomonas aeruginosa]
MNDAKLLNILHSTKTFAPVLTVGEDGWGRDVRYAEMEEYSYMGANGLWVRYGDFRNLAIETVKSQEENQMLRSVLEAFVLRAEAYIEAGRGMPDVSMEAVLEKARTALEGAGK